MITADTDTVKNVKVMGLCNRGEWFGKTWLIGIACGYSTLFYVVEAKSEEEAIDNFVDSKHGHMIKIYDDSDVDEFTYLAGNFCEPIDVNEIRLLEKCKLNYFVSEKEYENRKNI